MNVFGKKNKAPCPLCNKVFTKRSLQSLDRLNSMVSSIRNIINSYETDIINQGVYIVYMSLPNYCPRLNVVYFTSFFTDDLR